MASHGSSIIFRDVIRWLNKATKKRRRYHHIFKGEVRRDSVTGEWKAQGLHHRYLGHDMPDRHVGPIIRQGHGGEYAADVSMKASDGEWVQKAGGSTFFPDDWRPRKVVEAIDDAFSRRVDLPGGRRWRGVSDGITIDGSYHRNGRWNSAWPVALFQVTTRGHGRRSTG